MVVSAFQRGRLYDPTDKDRVHADMREDLPATLKALERQGLVRAAHENCVECEQIRAAARLRPARASRRRMKFVLKPSDMHRLLQLPEGHQIVFMYSLPDPNAVMVLVEGADLEEIPESAPSPAANVKFVL